MKRIVLFYMMFSSFVFLKASKKEKIIGIINKNIEFSCEYKEKTVSLKGVNFNGNYYKGKPYGLWELKKQSKNGKEVRQCFLKNESRYYYKGKYYIVNNKNYYLKINYEKNFYIYEDKKRNKRYYFEKKDEEYVATKYISGERRIPKPLYELMYFRLRERVKENMKFDFSLYDFDWGHHERQEYE